MYAKLWIFILLLFLSFFAKSQEIVNAKVLDSIKQKDSITTISEVIIESSRRNFKLNDGNIVMSISGNKDFKTSTNILEVLRKTPGVSVDQEDGIFIGGRIGPAIFINGKPVVMSSQELQAYLRSLSPEMVESIEVNANPSSKYDAEFKGVIDIKLRRNTNLGWRGNYIGNVSINRFSNRENTLNLSYNTGKFAYNLQLGYNNGMTTYRYNALRRLANTNVMRTKTYQKDEAGVESQNFSKYTSIPDRREAIKMAIKFAEPKDIVLVAGKGHETYQDMNGVKHHFDDKETINELWKLMSK